MESSHTSRKQRKVAPVIVCGTVPPPKPPKRMRPVEERMKRRVTPGDDGIVVCIYTGCGWFVVRLLTDFQLFKKVYKIPTQDSQAAISTPTTSTSNSTSAPLSTAHTTSTPVSTPTSTSSTPSDTILSTIPPTSSLGMKCKCVTSNLRTKALIVAASKLCDTVNAFRTTSPNAKPIQHLSHSIDLCTLLLQQQLDAAVSFGFVCVVVVYF